MVVIDDLSSGHADAVDPRARLVRLDIAQQAEVVQALSSCSADVVVHMAAHSLVGESVSEPRKYYRNNVTGGLALRRDARGPRASHGLFVDSGRVWRTGAAADRGDRPTLPTNPYGATKLAFEQALAWYALAYGPGSTSLRYINLAGATARCGERHDPETHLIPLMLDAAAGRRPHLGLSGDDYPTPDGTCVRDYVHVTDIARAHVLALHAQRPAEATAYNLGSAGGYSVKQVIDAGLA